MLLLAALNCAAQVHIREVGLQGYVGYSGPQRLRVEMSNPSARAETYVLRVTGSYQRSQNYHADHEIRLNAGETRTFDLPVLTGTRNKLKVEQVNAGGLSVSSDEGDISTEASGLIAVVCAAPSVCKAISDAVRFGRSVEEQNAKERELKIVSITEPPQSWFAWEPARTVIIGGPIDNSSARDALENYARFGGDVIVVSDVAPRDFLAAYRTDDTRKVPIGNGTLRFVNTSSGQQLREMFQPEKTQRTGEGSFTVRFMIGGSPLMQWTGTRFVFPRLSWLIFWMVFYTVVVGVINFFVLRRIGKVELGWLTVPGIAILFAVLFYSISMRGKMTHFALDEATVCFMDDKSSIGVAEHHFRVASPQVRDVVLAVPANAVISSPGRDPLFRASDAANLWNDDNENRQGELSDILVDAKQQHVPLEMLRFSFRDLEFRSVQQLAGTVRIKDGVLRNDTGQNFSQSALIDFRSGVFYDLGPLPNGGNVRTGGKPEQRLSQRMFPFRDRHQAPVKPEFKLAEFLTSEPFTSPSPRNTLTFVGFTEQPLVTGRLEGISPQNRVSTLFLVTLERPK